MIKRKSLYDKVAENAKAMENMAKVTGKPMPDGYKEMTAHIIQPSRQVKRPSLYADPKKSKPTIPLEHEEQKDFVKWFKAQYPKVKIFAVPNSALRSYELAAYLKAEGMATGCQDLWIPEFLMCIEMKRVKGSVTSPDQIEWRDYMLSIGWCAHICNGFEAARLAVLENRKCR